MTLLFQHGSDERDLGSNPLLAQPLPRLSSDPRIGLTGVESGAQSDIQRVSVLVVGAGPAGLFATLLLARYGIPQSSLLCIDSRADAVKAGHADGVTPRTMEILSSLGLADEIAREANQMVEQAGWQYVQPDNGQNGPGGIRREHFNPMSFGSWRYGGIRTIHQGRLERILEDDLLRYHRGKGVRRNVELIDVRIDDMGDADYPVLVTVKGSDGKLDTIRTQYLIGADGARSKVRTELGIEMEGELTDDIWGVLDFIADTDFPDIRRPVNIAGPLGSILLIPREVKSNDDRITRLYVLFEETAAQLPNGAANGDDTSEIDVEQRQRRRRSGITPEGILAVAAEMFKPYQLRLKPGTEVEWWAAYQIGQRVASRLVEKDSKDTSRVFLIGDACHTHSPKLGQGMNVSMVDAYDLSWKLAHVLLGLVPDGQKLLDTFAHDRRQNALNLIDLDRRWYEMRYARQQDGSHGMKNSELMDMIAEFSGFVGGTTIQYDDNTLLVDKRMTSGVLESEETDLAAVMREGRRLADAKVVRFADGVARNLQDEFPSDGRYSVLIWTASDLLDKRSNSAQCLDKLCETTLANFPKGLVRLVVLHSLEHHSFEWTDLPSGVRREAEMQLFRADEKLYKLYGVDVKRGRVAVIRPDQFVGSVADWNGLDKVERYLERCLVRI